MSTKRPTLDQYFLSMLPIMALRSTCVRRQVACIITNYQGHILATGFNGTPAGMTHCIDVSCPGAFDKSGDTSRCEAIHAEANALLQCRQLEHARTLYCSVTPCFTCAKMICNTPITRVIVLEQYADTQGAEMLKRKGIAVYYE